MINNNRPFLLMHACCGPCSTSCVERLYEDYAITLFYYNPNITDSEEYFLRRDNLLKFINAFNKEHPGADVKYIEGEYEPEEYIKRAQSLADEPEGGKRCTVCFNMRLSKTAAMADKVGADFFTTTLTVSPHKNYPLISKIGNMLGNSTKAEYLDIDFKKKNGFGRSVELSKKYGLYRQRFCGCEYARRMQNNEKI